MFGITYSHKNVNDDQTDREHWKNGSENHMITRAPHVIYTKCHNKSSTMHGRHKPSSKCRQQHQDAVRGGMCPSITAARLWLGFRRCNDVTSLSTTKVNVQYLTQMGRRCSLSVTQTTQSGLSDIPSEYVCLY
jgi:hypothetical protein